MKQTRSLQIIALLFFINALAIPAECQMPIHTSPPTLNTIDSVVQKNMQESGTVGIAAAIIVNKKLVWMKGYGYADIEKKIAFTPNTLMSIASITKTFTGVCVMKAWEEGKLSLDEDINTYLPFKVVNPYFPNEKITLRNLGTHTSGITDREPIYGNSYYYGGDSPISLGDFLADYFVATGKLYSKDNFLQQKPGSYWEYSNISVGLAGYIVERVTGKKLSDYSKEHILKPLKMKNTGWFLSEIDLANHTRLYDKQGDTLKIIPLYGLATYPDGGVRSSVSELTNYFIALLNNGEYNGVRILKKATMDTMQKFQFTAANKPDNVDLSKRNAGIFWATKDGGKKIGYGGTDPGLKTEMLSDLKKEVAVILFSNTSLTIKDLLKYYFGIYEELWRYGVKVSDAQKKSSNQ